MEYSPAVPSAGFAMYTRLVDILPSLNVAACIFKFRRMDDGIDCGVLVAAFIRAVVTGAATSSVLNFIPFNACGVAALRVRHRRST
jgi:hypothetical protein